jgi:molecular chaperone GrpE
MNILDDENEESHSPDDKFDPNSKEEEAIEVDSIERNSSASESSMAECNVEEVGPGNKVDQVGNTHIDNASTIPYLEIESIKHSLNKMAESYGQLESQFSILQNHFESKIHYDESKERMIDALHKELQSYRDGLHYRHIRPISMGLIDLLDDLESILNFQANLTDESSEAKRMRRNLEVTCDSIKAILEENGVVSFSEAGDVFNRKRQRVQRTEPTDNPELSGKVCKRLHMGYEYDDIVMRPEVVSTWKYMPKQEVL